MNKCVVLYVLQKYLHYVTETNCVVIWLANVVTWLGCQESPMAPTKSITVSSSPAFFLSWENLLAHFPPAMTGTAVV